MPFFREDDLQSLTGESLPVDSVLDLVETERAAALLALEEMLAAAHTGNARRVAVRFQGAMPGGGETLFLPIGRRLLEARKRGVIGRFAPLSGGDGFICELPGARAVE